MGNQEWTIKRNWKHWEHRTQQEMCWTSLCANKQNYVNKTCALPQTTGGKDEPNIVFVRKS